MSRFCWKTGRRQYQSPTVAQLQIAVTSLTSEFAEEILRIIVSRIFSAFSEFHGTAFRKIAGVFCILVASKLVIAAYRRKKSDMQYPDEIPCKCEW